MQHRLFAPVVLTGLLVAAGLSSQAFAADPTGIWAKDDGSAKMEVTKCGRGLCSKIVWLQNPKDSRGKPLRDARNENTSMRDRPILGLPLFSRMAPAGDNAWVGNVYNPEEGRIYADVKVTLVSSRQIVLRGCKAMLFCGEKIWTRSQLPPSAMPPSEEPVEIEAKAPAATPAPGTQAAAGGPEYIAPGVVATPTKTEPLPLSGEDVPSMMVMNKPAPEVAVQTPSNNQAAIEAESTPPLPVRAPDASAQPQVAAKPTAEKPQVTAANPKSAHVANRSTAEPAVAPADAKPKAPVRQVQQEPQERLPWERPQGYTPSYLGFQQGSPPGAPPAGPIRGLFGGLFR
jgi:uncharacterized protein (DUF2147 family)